MPFGRKIFQREQRSLFGEILDWMLTPLLILWPVSLILTWLVAQNIAGRPYDHALELQVRALAQHLSLQQAGTQVRTRFDPPMPARTLLHADASDTLHFQVLGIGGEFLSGDPSLPPPPPLDSHADIARPGLEPGTVALRNSEFEGTPVRSRPCLLTMGRPPQTRRWPWSRLPKPRTSVRNWLQRSSKA
jgi:two-component system sensor histidine kinase TctE